MDIFNKLHISYQAKSIVWNGEFRTYNIFIDGETILIENSNFSQLPLQEQLVIVKKFIVKDRQRYKLKEYIKIGWREVQNGQNALQQNL
jgi:hypothetical protein